jgi:amino acid adenylation domain-containing protein
VGEETREFWRNALKEHTADLDLTLDRQRPRLPTFAGEALYRDFPPELATQIKQLARSQRCSVYMICLAALQVLIHRYTGQEKFCVATPFSDRDDTAFENTIGYLINLLPVPCTVEAGQPFSELLEVTRANCLEAYANNAISFRQILKELNLPSDSPKPPLARVVFQYFPETPALELPGLASEQLRVHSRTSKFDLCFSLFEHNGTITTELEYDSDIFTAESAEAWERQYVAVLQSIVANPAEPCGTLSIVPKQDARHIAQWNDTIVAYPRNSTVSELFEAQAKLHPDATALVFDAGKLTYRELDERANAIAAELQNRGVRPGEYVGVCLKRSPELIAALIGILKAGAAFVPFELSYPKARLEYLFKDSGVRLLVTDSRNARLAPAGTDLLLVSNGRLSQFASQGQATDVAYVMYTSGSTGDPKGVMVPHRAITRLVKNNTFASFAPTEVWLAFAPVSFDASTLEIWAPLLNGGTLAIYPSEFESVEQFESVLKRFNVTSLWLTAGLFNTIVDQRVEALRGVRQLLVGGDVLSVAHIRKALTALPQTELINGYGPTENTTFTCCYSIPRQWPEERSIPIGKPIRNTRVHILDERMQPVPVGVPGDLYASGDGLSLGYLNKPELTAAAFITHAGDRLYRTGDRARYLPTGDIEFLGRRDAQVKIRGFRIELGEVESALRRVEGIQDVAVVAHADAGGSKQLVAYVVPRGGQQIDAARIKSEAGALLPDHACPNVIIPLAELPLGPNGKVNKNALPKPGSLDTSRSAAAAENPVEARLVEIFEQILEVPGVSVDDNFFHCGGESLRATRAISQINRAFGCRLTLPKLFEAPTVRQMARLVEASSGNSENGIRVSKPVQSGGTPIEVESLSDDEVDALLNQLVNSDDSAEPVKQLHS